MSYYVIMYLEFHCILSFYCVQKLVTILSRSPLPLLSPLPPLSILLLQRIIQRFDEEGMLYLVPQGADDDWYWIYATVTEGRTEPAYVVRHDFFLSNLY